MFWFYNGSLWEFLSGLTEAVTNLSNTYTEFNLEGNIQFLQ